MGYDKADTDGSISYVLLGLIRREERMQGRSVAFYAVSYCVDSQFVTFHCQIVNTGW